MRRLFAFITLVLSLVIAAVVGLPTIINKTTAGTEFDGGYSIVYHVTGKGGEAIHNKTQLETYVDQAIESMDARLNVFGISDPDISVEDDEYIRVTIPEVSDAKLESIRLALQNNARVTITDGFDNVLFLDAYKVFDEIFLYVNSGTVYSQFKVGNKEELKSVTEQLVADTQDSEEANFVVWLGFEEAYSDEKAEFVGFAADKYSETTSNTYAAFKLITATAVSEAIEEDFSIQSMISSENVSIVNKILDQDKQNFMLNEVNTSKVGNNLNSNIPNRAIAAVFVAIAIIAVLMIVFYKYAGFVSALSTVCYAVAVLVVYNLFGGLFGIETIIALLVGLVVAVDANIVFLERIKDEIRKGKTVARSFEEGSKKSASTVLDCNIILIIAAFALYLFGNQIVKSFSSVVIISQVVIMIVVILLTRLLLNLLCHSSKFENKPAIFGVKENEISDINNLEVYTAKNKFSNVNFLKKGGLKGIVGGAVVAVGIILAVVFNLTGVGTFNGRNNVAGGTRLYFRTVDTTLATVEDVNSFLVEEIGKEANKVTIEVEHILLTDTQKASFDVDGYLINSEAPEDQILAEFNGNTITVYDVTCYFTKELSNEKVTALDSYFEVEENLLFNEDDEIDVLKTNYSCKNFVSSTIKNAMISGLKALGMMIAFAFIYMVIRFSMSYAISAILTVLVDEVLYYAVLSISRLAVGAEAVAIGLAVALLSLVYLAITFDKLRENIAEAGNISWNKEERKNYVNTAIQQTMYGHLFTTLSAVVSAVAIMAICGFEIISVGVNFVIVIAATFFGSFGIMPYIWVQLEGVFSKAKAKRKERRAIKNKENPVDAGEPKEYTFFGIND